MKKLHVLFLLVVIGLFLVGFIVIVSSQFVNPKQKPDQDSSFWNLRWLRGPLSSAECDYSKDLIYNDTGNSVEIVSAEKVFRKLFPDSGDSMFSKLVSPDYYKTQPPINPAGRNIVEKWGSSFYSWLAPTNSWPGVKDFTSNGFGFPILWDKKPELNRGFYNALMLVANDMPCDVVTLDSGQFEQILKNAEIWLNPEQVSVEQIVAQVKNGTIEEQKFAIRLLGRKKEIKGIEIIKEYLENDFSWKAQQSAFWAIGEIKDKSAITLLIKSFYRDKAEADNIVEAMCKIGGGQVGKELKDWLNDPEMSKRERRDIINGIGIARYVPGKELIEPFLKSDDKDLKRAAEQAMERLSKE